MRKDNFYLAVVGVLFVGVLAVFYSNSIRSKTDTNQQNGAFVPVVDSNFKPRQNADLPFEADLRISYQDDSNNLEGKIQYDSIGTVRFEVKQAGEFIELYITPTETIVCSENKCFSSDSDAGSDIFNIESLIYAKQDLRGLGDGLRSHGEVECGELPCELWKSSSVVPTPISSVVLEKESGLIKSIEGIDNGAVVSVDFDYRDVTVVLPLNVSPAVTE